VTRHLRQPAFPDDDGRPDLQLRAALAGDLRVAHPRLRRARLLVPVVAKGRDMATVTMTGRDGRIALLAFTGLDALTGWRGDARPVPVRAVDAARAALAEGAHAVLLDVAGPRSVAIAGPALAALADDRPWLAAIDDRDVVDIVHQTVSGLGLTARVEAGGGDADLTVVLDGAVADAHRCAAALERIPLLRVRLERGVAIALADRSPRSLPPRS
jgi:hypothetical protein